MWIFILILTCAVSYYAFENTEVFNKLKLNPFMAWHKGEWYRVLTHALVHADWNHLILNMLVLFFFAPSLTEYFSLLFGKGPLIFLIMYLIAIPIASITTILKHKNNHWYNSVGASGAISAVVFANIFFDPMGLLYVFFILPIPGIIFGIAYLAYSHYLSRRGNDNINHEAHIFGAVFGFFFPWVTCLIIHGQNIFPYFLREINIY